jgi:hypothetical protein
MRRSIFLTVGAAAALAPLSARAEVKVVWQASTDLRAVAVDHAGDVVGVGRLSAEHVDFRFGVAKLDGATGKSRWRVVLRKTKAEKEGWAFALAIGRANEVFAVGELGQTEESRLVVTKLTAAGKVVWTSHLDAPTSEVDHGGTAIVVDPKGDVIASVYDNVQNSPPDVNPATYTGTDYVVKLAGASGKLLWKQTRKTPPNTQNGAFGSKLTMDSNGDVFVYFDQSDSLRKLSGSTGAVMWESKNSPSAVKVTGQGDIVTAGVDASQNFEVSKLTGDGHVLWRKKVCDGGGPWALALVDGDAIVSGNCGWNNVASVVARFDAKGERLWKQPIPTVVTVSKDHLHSQKWELTPEFVASIPNAVVVGLAYSRPIAVLALSPSTGQTIWQWKDASPSLFQTAGLAVQGTSVYLAGEDSGFLTRVPRKPRAAVFKLDAPCGTGADVKTDRANCGACDRRCLDTQVCVDGRCAAPEPEECVCRDGTRVRAGGQACEHVCRGHDHPRNVQMPPAN